MSYYQPGAPPPHDPPDQPEQPTARSAPPWWRGRVVVSVFALAIGTILGAAIVVEPDTTATAGADPEPAPTVTVTEQVPQERLDELDDREKSLDARDGRLDDRQDELNERQGELDTREAGLDEREGALDARKERLDERKGALDDREAGLDDRDSAITQAEDEVASNTIPGDGLYVVGEEIQPGNYRASGGGNSCYWARLSGLSGDFDDLIANHFGAAKTTVAIQASDTAFETTGCGEWVKVS